MSEPLQVTGEQLQAILNAVNTAGINIYPGYLLTSYDVCQVNQQLQSSGIEVDLSIIRVDFADGMGGTGGMAEAFDGIQNAIEQGFTAAIQHLADPSYSPGHIPTSAKMDELQMEIGQIRQALQNLPPSPPVNLGMIEMELTNLTASVNNLTEAASLGLGSNAPIPKDKAGRAAQKVFNALQAKPAIYEALLDIIREDLNHKMGRLPRWRLSGNPWRRTSSL